MENRSLKLTMTATTEKQLDKPDVSKSEPGVQASSSDTEAKDAPFIAKRWPIYAWSLLWVGWIGFLFFMMVTRVRSGQPL